MAKSRRRRRSSRRKPDPLSVQVSITARVPKGVKVSKNALNEVYYRWVRTGELPKGWKINGIFWRNSDRKGKLSYWRYSEGSEKAKHIPRPIESAPRGDHELARETLGGALLAIRPF